VVNTRQRGTWRRGLEYRGSRRTVSGAGCDLLRLRCVLWMPALTIDRGGDGADEDAGSTWTAAVSKCRVPQRSACSTGLAHVLEEAA
jgi:hypothetical protein